MLAPSMGEGRRLSKKILNLYVNLWKTEIVCMQFTFENGILSSYYVYMKVIDCSFYILILHSIFLPFELVLLSMLLVFHYHLQRELVVFFSNSYESKTVFSCLITQA